MDVARLAAAREGCALCCRYTRRVSRSWLERLESWSTSGARNRSAASRAPRPAVAVTIELRPSRGACCGRSTRCTRSSACTTERRNSSRLAVGPLSNRSDTVLYSSRGSCANATRRCPNSVTRTVWNVSCSVTRSCHDVDVNSPRMSATSKVVSARRSRPSAWKARATSARFASSQAWHTFTRSLISWWRLASMTTVRLSCSAMIDAAGPSRNASGASLSCYRTARWQGLLRPIGRGILSTPARGFLLMPVAHGTTAGYWAMTVP